MIYRWPDLRGETEMKSWLSREAVLSLATFAPAVVTAYGWIVEGEARGDWAIAGYATAAVGKWGLGMPQDKSSPLDMGFDHHYGYLCQAVAHTYYPPYLWRDNNKEVLKGNLPYDVTMKGAIPPGGKPTTMRIGLLG